MKWSKKWRERAEGQFPRLVEGVVSELEAASLPLAKLVEEAELEAEAQRRKWAEQRERMRIVAENARRAKARADAKQDILSAIKAWDDARRIHYYFDAAERDANGLVDEMRAATLDRLSKPRELIGSMGALEVLRSWKPRRSDSQLGMEVGPLLLSQ